MSDSLYREKYVAFVDMLGFSNLVREADTDPLKRATIVDAIDRLKDTCCNNPQIGLVVTYFSDCLVLSSDRTRNGLAEILMSIKTIAENLLIVDVMIRGGLTVGRIHHDENFMFGPGMLEAYDMERSDAVHPTILVGAAVQHDIEQAGFDQMLIDDSREPERRYLHYLITFANYDPTPRNGLMILDEQALLIRHFIAKRLRDCEGKTLAKAKWLERYWNETVGDNGSLGRVDREADLLEPDVAPFRTVRRIWGG